MANASLFSNPPNPVVDKNMTDSELAGDEREDGELEDGEIDDEGIGIEDERKETKEAGEEKEKEKEKDDRARRRSRKRYKKARDKRRFKKRRRDRQKHHSPSSSDSSDSFDSEHEHPERPKSRKNPGSYRDYDGQFTQHGQSSGHAKSQRQTQHKNSDFDKFSDYSEEKYEYDGEDDDFAEELCHYRQAKDVPTPCQGKGGPARDQGKRPGMKGGQKQQQYTGMKGRGRGGMGRGRGIQYKNRKQKGKNWGRGRGRGAEQGGDGMKEDGKGLSNFQKKRPIMTQEFINQHTVEHNGRYICKYFLEGRCIKGDQCKFEHHLVVPDKKKELCKFYLQGYCSKGEKCIYMHNEYPCKFFHTGAKCYQGDNCKFSHEPLTDLTRELLEKVLNTEEELMDEDEQELEELRKQGIAPLPKPPPGVGLLPTPGPSSPQEVSPCGKKIPSLFEIVVQPTVDLAQKIGLRPSFYNSTSPPQGPQFQGNGPPPQYGDDPEDMQDMQGANMPPGPCCPAPPPGSPGSVLCSAHPHGGPALPHGFQQGANMLPPAPPGQDPAFHGSTQGNRPASNPQQNQQGPPFLPMPDLQMQQNIPYPSVGPNPAEFFESYYGHQTVCQGEESLHLDPLAYDDVQISQSGAAEPNGSVQVPDFLPAVQKALFLRLSQKHPEDEPLGVEGSGEKTPSRAKDDATNWYSSDDEEGNGMTAILKSLKKQNEMMKNPLQPKPHPPGLSDPRLRRERASLSDPRTKADPRKEAEMAADPRLVRDPRKRKPPELSTFKAEGHRPHHHPQASAPYRPPAGEEDEEGERELREKAAVIPLEPCPGVALRDPRCQIKPFSHIRVDILLSRPAFAQSVVWAPEDLIPLLIPRQEPSINLPLPPLIADAQLNLSLCPPTEPTPSPSPSHLDPRLAATRLKETASRAVGPSGRSSELKPSSEKPLDPRTQKASDPRVSRSGSLDSRPSALKESSGGSVGLDPRLQRGGSGSSPHHATPAHTPTLKMEPERLPPYAPRLSSSNSGLGSPTSLLGGICLYDPRIQAAPSSKEDGVLKQAATQDGALPSLPPAPDGRGLDSHAPPPCAPLTAPAVHNLPIQALAGLIRPPYADPRQARPTGQAAGAPQEGGDTIGEAGDRPLKDVFKTFDPTASPFCQ